MAPANAAYPTRSSRSATPVRRVVPAKRQGPKKLLGLLTVIVIPGFLAATSIPAFAIGTPPSFGEAELLSAEGHVDPIDLQAVSVSASAEIAVERQAFTAETHAQLMSRKAATLRATARAGAFGVVGPRQAGDDYPFRGQYGLTSLRYVGSQCTDFVAWRINRDKGVTGEPWAYTWANMTPGGGSASAWARAWANNGWKTSTTPVVGAVAWFNGNHVAYVKSVSGGSVFLEEYNWNGSASYHTRTIPSSSVALFLYPPP
ncbi:CHAP domain-containing protein [Glaciihabitans arcticus]|uniref:CHAP domain-containing protein n=1 Tax=Glaciihabitans arcticus TaxID=2668039 RepID=A0A4Q9GXU0_9MICO|nr:CHAP domain-containing protein [Glaciihabitans arcticus]TBN58438.1 CHAP domain-containing protein [Glaciihabitans arcticus]